MDPLCNQDSDNDLPVSDDVQCANAANAANAACAADFPGLIEYFIDQTRQNLEIFCKFLTDVPRLTCVHVIFAAGTVVRLPRPTQCVDINTLINDANRCVTFNTDNFTRIPVMINGIWHVHYEYHNDSHNGNLNENIMNILQADSPELAVVLAPILKKHDAAEQRIICIAVPD